MWSLLSTKHFLQKLPAETSPTLLLQVDLFLLLPCKCKRDSIYTPSCGMVILTSYLQWIIISTYISECSSTYWISKVPLKNQQVGESRRYAQVQNLQDKIFNYDSTFLIVKVYTDIQNRKGEQPYWKGKCMHIHAYIYFAVIQFSRLLGQGYICSLSHAKVVRYEKQD